MYEKIDVENAQNVKSIFENLLGIDVIVKKKRKIYLFKNVRIHLDEISNLGSFIEFEAVFDKSNSNEKEENEKINFLLKYLDVKQEDLISKSYENLMKDKIN